jgi:hypothetical protein
MLSAFEGRLRGIYAKSSSAGNKNGIAAARLWSLSYLAFLRPAADRTEPLGPWVVSRGSHLDFWDYNKGKKINLTLWYNNLT